MSCDKVTFPTLKAAERQARRYDRGLRKQRNRVKVWNGKRRKYTAYRCRACGKFHLTTSKAIPTHEARRVGDKIHPVHMTKEEMEAWAINARRTS